MSLATEICLGLTWLAVSCAALGLPRLAVAFVVTNIDLSLAGQVIPALDADPLVMLGAGTALLTVLGTIVSPD